MNNTYENRMSNLTVRYFLGLYKLRLKMQEEGQTNPAQEFKDITRIIVEKLSKLPPEETLTLGDDRILKDSKGNIIVQFPPPPETDRE